MVWTLVAPVCNQSSPRVGIDLIPANAIDHTIFGCFPTPPFPLFITSNWVDGGIAYTQFDDHIDLIFGAPAPADGSGLISWEWENP